MDIVDALVLALLAAGDMLLIAYLRRRRARYLRMERMARCLATAVRREIRTPTRRRVPRPTRPVPAVVDSAA